MRAAFTVGEMVDLSSVRIFDGAAESSKALITEDMVRCYKTDDQIVTENDPGLHLIVLLKGEARVLSNGTYLVTRRAGEIIGEQAILDGVGRSATVIAQGMVEALLISATATRLLLQDHVFGCNVARALSCKLREATNERSRRYRQEEELFAEFSAHVSPEQASKLLAMGKRYGDPRFVNAVLLMSDIRGFTATCRRMTPSQIAAELTPYLDAVVDIIQTQGGMIDKFIGDAVLATWGVTPCDGNHASAALKAAKEMLTCAAGMRFGHAPIRIGIGLNAGLVFAGNIGSQRKAQFTVLGTPVNLVARLESQCKELGAEIVAGEDFYKLLPDTEKPQFPESRKVSMKGAGQQAVYPLSIAAAMSMALGER